LPSSPVSRGEQHEDPGRALETYILTGADQLEEVFERAAPGNDFELYSRNRLKRVN
jgi:hypothetical protein